MLRHVRSFIIVGAIERAFPQDCRARAAFPSTQAVAVDHPRPCALFAGGRSSQVSCGHEGPWPSNRGVDAPGGTCSVTSARSSLWAQSSVPSRKIAAPALSLPKRRSLHFYSAKQLRYVERVASRNDGGAVPAQMPVIASAAKQSCAALPHYSAHRSVLTTGKWSDTSSWTTWLFKVSKCSE